jgi:hypothetical protein
MSANEARADLLHLINGFQASQAIHVAATLKLADLLGSGAKTTADIAGSTKTHPVSLYRLMRALAAIGVFHEDEEHRFALTAVGEFLRSDVSGTHAPMAELVGRPYFRQAWGDLIHTVRTGVTAFDHAHGKNVWEYRTERPDEERIFDRSMATATERFAEAVLDACDFGRFQHIVDVGGGDGMFLAKILAAHPRIHGTLFDQPHVITRAAASMDSLGFSGRCQGLGGNFFVNLPEGADAYLLKWILHDWDDKASIDILRSCRRAMKPASKLFIVEHVIGPPNTSREAKFMDLSMMVLTGGRERTRDEFAVLLADAGFRLLSVTPTVTPLSVIEGALEQP